MPVDKLAPLVDWRPAGQGGSGGRTIGRRAMRGFGILFDFIHLGGRRTANKRKRRWFGKRAQGFLGPETAGGIYLADPRVTTSPFFVSRI